MLRSRQAARALKALTEAQQISQRTTLSASQRAAVLLSNRSVQTRHQSTAAAYVPSPKTPLAPVADPYIGDSPPP